MILAALACGLAILVAGTVQLLRLRGSENSTARVLDLGATAQVGDLTVTARRGDPVEGKDRFHISYSVAEGSGPVALDGESWTMQVGDRRANPLDVAPADATPPDCSTLDAVTSETPVECVVVFEPADGTTYLRFSLAGRIGTWVVEG